jgi:hypothetical protein
MKLSLKNGGMPLKRNIKPTEITYVKILLQKYGQDQLDNDPTIIIDTVHSVKGGESR